MPIADQSRVQQLIDPHAAEIVATYQRAWDRWWQNPERPELYRRTRACLIHNYVMCDAIVGMEARGIVVKERQETALFLVNDELVFRFKKGDESGRTSNIETQCVLDFIDPNENLALFGLPDLCRVDVAYVLNDLETKIHDVLVVARNNDAVIWSYSIMRRGEGAAGLAIPLQIDPHQPPAADSRMRVPGSDKEVEKQGNDGST